MSNFYPNINNSTTLGGRLTKDPENISNGNVAKFTLAVDRGLSKKGKEEAEARGEATVDFVNCIAFGYTAKNILKLFKKGSAIMVSAKFQNNNYEKDGKTVFGYQFVVTNWGFPLGGSGNTNTNTNTNNSKGQVSNTNKAGNDFNDDFSSFNDDDDDDIPF